jgi:hypothetical protein
MWHRRTFHESVFCLHMCFSVEPYVTKNILAIRQNFLLEQTLLQQLMQCKNTSTFLYMYPEILSSDRFFKNIQLCYGIFWKYQLHKTCLYFYTWQKNWRPYIQQQILYRTLSFWVTMYDSAGCHSIIKFILLEFHSCWIHEQYWNSEKSWKE